MFYAGSAVTAGIPGARAYLPAAPMSAVLPGHSYYPAMHSAPIAAHGYPMSAAPMVYGGGAYGGGAYGGAYGGGAYGGSAYGGHAHRGSGYGYSSYYGQPTVILSSAPRSRRSRSSRSRGFLGYL